MLQFVCVGDCKRSKNPLPVFNPVIQQIFFVCNNLKILVMTKGNGVFGDKVG